jgi:DNA-binding GntR family transcriptional regulator
LSERYLDRVPGHGYFVAHVTSQVIHDTIEVRRLLEAAAARQGTAAEIAVRRITAGGERPLECRSPAED